MLQYCIFRSKFEILPRTSSRNFDQDEIGEPIIDVILRPGDFLYMPRGYIHQADTLFTETHSLHLTFSTYQQNSIFDFLKVVRKIRSNILMNFICITKKIFFIKYIKKSWYYLFKFFYLNCSAYKTN